MPSEAAWVAPRSVIGACEWASGEISSSRDADGHSIGAYFAGRCSVIFPTYKYRTGGRSRYRGDLPSKFEMPRTAKKLPSTKAKPSTAKNLPSCCVTAEKVPSKFDSPFTAKNLPPTLIPCKNYRKLSYRIKTTVTLIPYKNYRQYCIPYKNNRQYCIPPERYRQHWIPPTRHRLFFLVFMFSSAIHHIVGSHIHILRLHVTCNTYVTYCCD